MIVVGESGGPSPLLLLLRWCETKDMIVVIGKDLPKGGGGFHPQLRAQRFSAMVLRLALKILKLFTVHEKNTSYTPKAV